MHKGLPFCSHFYLYFVALSQLVNIIKLELNLPQMRDIFNSKNLQGFVRIRRLSEVFILFPRPNASAPRRDIEDNHIFDLGKVSTLSIDLKRNEFSEIILGLRQLLFDEVESAHLRVNEFVRELGKEELGVGLPELVEVQTELGVEADSKIVVHPELFGKLAVRTFDYYLPTIDFLLLSFAYFLQKVYNLELLVIKSPAQTAAQVVPCPQRNYADGRLGQLQLLAHILQIISNCAYSTVPASHDYSYSLNQEKFFQPLQRLIGYGNHLNRVEEPVKSGQKGMAYLPSRASVDNNDDRTFILSHIDNRCYRLLSTLLVFRLKSLFTQLLKIITLYLPRLNNPPFQLTEVALLFKLLFALKVDCLLAPQAAHTVTPKQHAAQVLADLTDRIIRYIAFPPLMHFFFRYCVSSQELASRFFFQFTQTVNQQSTLMALLETAQPACHDLFANIAVINAFFVRFFPRMFTSRMAKIGEPDFNGIFGRTGSGEEEHE